MDDSFTGIIEEETPGGKIVVPYVNGKKEGKAVANFGTRRTEMEYRNDAINGVVSEYHNGAKVIEMEYLDGRLHGNYKAYHENGMPQVETTYKDGKLGGVFTVYDEFGDVVMKCEYKNGLKDGDSVMYYPRLQGGGVCEASKYKADLLEGRKVTYDAAGQPMTCTKYERGRAQTYPRRVREE